MTRLVCSSALALALAPVAVMASTDVAVVGARRIAAASVAPATSGGGRRGGAQACLEAEIAVYSHHSGQFWCAPVK